MLQSAMDVIQNLKKIAVFYNDWRAKTNKAANTRQWNLSEKNFYYCPNKVCLTRKRPLLSKENITIIYCDEGSIADIKENLSNFH